MSERIEGSSPSPAPAMAHKERLKDAFDESSIVCRTHVGGQALIEGIMMRGRYNWALAVRKPNGSIHVEEHDLASGKSKNSWMYKPVVRGCTALVESLALGYKALEIAANHAFDDGEDEPELEAEAAAPVCLDEPVAEGAAAAAEGAAAAEPAPAQAGTERMSGTNSSSVPADPPDPADSPEPAAAEPAMREPAAQEPQSQAEESESALPKSVLGISMVLGLVLGVGIFIVVPAIVTNLIVGDYGEKTLRWNLIDGILRVAIFVAYIFLIGRLSDIKRMFGYHGAEHRTIHCYERGRELTVANAQEFPSLHVRCGTAFMLMTMIIAILVFTLVPLNLLINGLGITNEVARLAVIIVSRIILVPLIAGLSYEFTVKWAGSHPDNPLVKVVLWPGLQMQRLTTNPPDDGMVECAIVAMNAVLAREAQEAEAAQPAHDQR